MSPKPINNGPIDPTSKVSQITPTRASEVGAGKAIEAITANTIASLPKSPQLGIQSFDFAKV
ncbi:MAG: hypothetical protein HOA17_03435 [Candidatus Melainabacteria bacterium]|jgi:hypothetical protein|nr:hypothetical protein [Candidatus Melainabacteria bacterium]